MDVLTPPKRDQYGQVCPRGTNPDAHEGAALIHGWNRDGALTCAPLDQAHTLDSAYTPTD